MQCTVHPQALIRVCLVAFILGVATQACARTPANASSLTPEMAYHLALEAQTTGDTGEMLTHLRHAARAGYLPAQ